MKHLQSVKNGLASVNVPATLARQKPRRKPVTLIVGIICRDGIVVAADSQTTWGTGKSWSANKLTDLALPAGRALIAEAGAALTSSAWIDELVKLAPDVKVFEEHGLPGMAEIAARKVRERLRNQNFDCSAEELQRFIESNELDSELMIVHYQNGPRIDTINLRVGIACRSKSLFEVIGSGADLAGYLLGELCQSESESVPASKKAVAVVETVKRHDPYCGGPTRLGILPDPKTAQTRPVIFSREETDKIVQLVLAAEVINKNNRLAVLEEATLEELATDKEVAAMLGKHLSGLPPA